MAFADVNRALRMPLRVDQDGQVAADPKRVEMVEEEEPIPTQEILDVVLRRDQQHVNAGVVQQRVEVTPVKGHAQPGAGAIPFMARRRH